MDPSLVLRVMKLFDDARPCKGRIVYSEPCTDQEHDENKGQSNILKACKGPAHTSSSITRGKKLSTRLLDSMPDAAL